ncbi:MAG: transposase [Thermoanaerobaculaceae bacterium]|jgi:REP element-mobilizing transposase RayT
MKRGELSDSVPVRRSTRLHGYDYAQAGAYFITVCTAARRCCLCDIAGTAISLTRAGRIVAEEWARSAELRPEVSLDGFVVMPNHVHGVLVLSPTVGATRRVAPGRGSASPLRSGASPGSLGTIVGQFKAASARRINALRGTHGRVFWQRGFYEHVIRNQGDLEAIRTYIADNPLQWALDRENPERGQLEARQSGKVIGSREPGTWEKT